MTYSSDVIALSPAIYWQLEESSGNVADSSGNGRTGTLTTVTTAPTYSVTGIPSGGTAISFANTGSAGSRFQAAATEDLTQATIVAWFKSSAGSFQTNAVIAGRYGSVAGQRVMVLVMSSNGTPTLQINGSTNNTCTDVSTRNDGAWHMIAGVLEGTGAAKTMRVYIDGTQTASTTPTLSSATPAAMQQDIDFHIGSSAGTTLRGFEGVVDEVAYFPNIVLTPTEIANLYSSGLGALNISGGLATETDSALSGTTIINSVLSGGLATETDSALSGTVTQAITGGLATETDSALSGTISSFISGNLATETDEALSGTVSVVLPGGLATETDEALAGSISAGQFISGGLAEETDESFTGTTHVTIVGGLAEETDSALAGTSLSPIIISGGLTSETDSALSGILILTLGGGIATETDSALAGLIITDDTTLGEIYASGESDSFIQPVIISNPELNRPGGRYRDGVAVADWSPYVEPVPDGIGISRKIVIAQQFDVPVMSGTQPIYAPTFKTETDYRTRIMVGGKDVSWFRGVQTPIPGFEMGEPLGWGTTTLFFPQIAGPFETLGAGDLSWLRPGSGVKLQRVDDETGDVLRTDYMGIVVAIDINGADVTVEVGGQLTGRAALRDKQPPLVQAREDIGEIIADRVRLLRLSHRPKMGITTGIKIQRFGGMSDLEHLQEVLSLAVTKEGAQWSTMPNDKGIYRTELKDYDTIHGSAYCDDSRVVAELRRDIAEEPNRVYASGVTKQGMMIKFGAYPGLLKSRPAPYPFNDGDPFGEGTVDADTDTGDGITVMIWRLTAMGYIDFRTPIGSYDEEVTEAVEALQRDVDLPVTGNMNKKSWAALYDLSATGYSLRKSLILPAAQTSETRKFRRTASGSVIARNPNFDPKVLVVDRTVEMGNGFTRKQIRRWAKQKLSSGNNWVGTITIHTGAILDGPHTPGSPIGDILRARDIRPGMNILLPLFDNGTVVHVSGVSVAENDGPVTLVVDTQARDVLEVWEVIQRNRDSRLTPMRSFMQQRRQSQWSKDRITFDEVGGVVDDLIECKGQEWTVFPVVASQAGSVQRIRFEVTNNTEYACAVFGKRIRPKKLKHKVGNPLAAGAKTKWDNENIRDHLDNRYVLLYAAGTKDDPCGYYPKSKSESPGAPLTGKWFDDAGFDYVTFHNQQDAGSVLWVAFWATQDTKIKPGRIMWPLSEEY